MCEQSSTAAECCLKLLTRSSVLAAGLPPNCWVPPAFLLILGSLIVPLDVCGALSDSSGSSLLGSPDLSGFIAVSFGLSGSSRISVSLGSCSLSQWCYPKE